MLKFFKIVLLLFICVIGFTLNSNAQIIKKAQVGFRFLDNPISAEVIGRGETGTTNTINSDGIFWNPALLGRIKNTSDVSLNYSKGIADINYNAGAATFKVGNFGVVGVSLLSMDYGTFYGTRRATNDAGYVETGEFSPTAYAVGIAFSQEISDRFSYGVQLKYASQNLGNAWVASSSGDIADPSLPIEQKTYKTGALAMDVGAHYDFQYHGLVFAAVLQNISRELVYEGEEFPMPFSINFGLSMEPLSFFDEFSGDHRFILNLESKHPRDFEQKFKIGGEYRFMNTFIARVGYMKGYDERSLTTGLGINYKVSDIPFRLDYAYLPFGIFGGTHYLSVSISYN